MFLINTLSSFLAYTTALINDFVEEKSVSVSYHLTIHQARHVCDLQLPHSLPQIIAFPSVQCHVSNFAIPRK